MISDVRAMMAEPTWITEKRSKRIAVLASPTGYHGNAYGIVIGTRRDTIDEARDDACLAADLIEASPCAAAHAWRMVN